MPNLKFSEVLDITSALLARTGIASATSIFLNRPAPPRTHARTHARIVDITSLAHARTVPKIPTYRAMQTKFH